MTTDVVAPPALVLTDPEFDTLCWVVTELHTLALEQHDGALSDLHREWTRPLFETPQWSPDGHVLVGPPTPTACRGLARILRLLAAAARPSVHPTGMVFYVGAREAVELADRIEGIAS